MNTNDYIQDVNMKDDTFSGKLSDDLKSRIEYFIYEVNLAWDNFIENLVINNQSLKENNLEDLYHNAIKKYKICSKLLVDTIKSKEDDLENSIVLSCEDITKYSMMTMILSGSILEASIQFFLLAYLDDYQKDEKYHWVVDGKSVDFKKIVNKIDEALTDLVDEKDITNKQKEKILNAVNDKLSLHDDWLEITKYPLDNLIQFCNENDIFIDKKYIQEDEQSTKKAELKANVNDHSFKAMCEGLDAKINDIHFNRCLSKEDILKGMKSIQANRNNIHLFTKHNICDIDVADNNINTLCKIIYDLGSRISYRNEIIEQMKKQYNTTYETD